MLELVGIAKVSLAAGAIQRRARAGPSPTAVAAGIPSIVIINVDSPRRELREAGNGTTATPHMDAYVAGAHRFTDTITPLARTNGSRVSILTGRHPVSTNARVNRMPRRLVRKGMTLPDAPQDYGHHEVYTTDEVRVANIDESLGFGQLITPPIGAFDFLLGYAGDMPLVNVLAASRAGRLLFPPNHADRAAHVTYRPDDYIERLADELVVYGPALLAIQLTQAHWPYSRSGLPTPSTPRECRAEYRNAVEEVDQQFEAFMRLLEQKGVVNNAIAGRYERSEIIDTAAVFYELDRESAWVRFREDRLRALLAQKQRAAISATAMLAAMPSRLDQNTRYPLMDRRNALPWTLEGPPDPAHDQEATRLCDALQDRFPG